MAELDIASMLNEITNRNNLKIAQYIGAQSALIPGITNTMPARPDVVPTITPTLSLPAPGPVRVTPEESTLARTPTEEVKAAVSAPTTQFGAIPDLLQQAVPTVKDPTTRSIEDLMSIASMLAPDVEAQPLTTEQLLGGDLFGLTAPEVTNVATTRLAQLSTKHVADKSALDFIRESTGQKTAEALVKTKIKEEGQQARAKFVADSAAAENVKTRNQSILLANRKAKVDIAKTFLEGKIKATAEAAKPVSNVDEWKSRKASILNQFSITNPLAAAGLTRIPDIDDALARLQEDKMAPDTLRMTKEDRDFYKAIVSLGAPPIEEVI